jgi:predicted nucleic acid-binding protein
VSGIVLDASVALALVVEEPGTSAALEAVADTEPIVPDTFWGEVANALVRKVKRGTIDRETAIAAMALLRRLVERTVPTEPLAATAMSLSLEFDRPTYDCLYLATAVAEDMPLVTADRALRECGERAGCGKLVRLVGV